MLISGQGVTVVGLNFSPRPGEGREVPGCDASCSGEDAESTRREGQGTPGAGAGGVCVCVCVCVCV